MARAYSRDLRDRVIDAVAGAGMSRRAAARRGLPPRFGLPRTAPPRAIRRSGFYELENDAVRIPEAAELEVAEAREVQRLRGREKRHALVL